MKIGVVNFHPSTNYGGILQYYALQTILERLGHEVQLVNRRWGTYLLPKQSLKQKIIKRIAPYDPFDLFRSAHCRIGMPIESDYGLLEYAQTQDAILAGSDQIWNMECMKVMGNYFFLDWVPENVRRFSYAASFGYDSYDANLENIAKTKMLLQRFENISVREYSGVELCKNLFGINAYYHIDPTLLLSVEDYRRLFQSCTVSHGDYILSYFLDKTKQKIALQNKLSQQERINVIDNNPTGNKWNRIFNSHKYSHPTIEQWLRNIHDARIVITDSFHGMVFSILFNKPFLCIGNQKRGMTRFESLCKTFHLGNIVYSESSLSNLLNKKEIIISNIDYTMVNQLLNVQRKRSIDYFNSWNTSL